MTLRVSGCPAGVQRPSAVVRAFEAAAPACVTQRDSRNSAAGYLSEKEDVEYAAAKLPGASGPEPAVVFPLQSTIDASSVCLIAFNLHCAETEVDWHQREFSFVKRFDAATRLQFQTVLLGLLLLIECGCDDQQHQVPPSERTAPAVPTAEHAPATLASPGPALVRQRHNDADKFAGQQACRECHSDIWDAYTGTHAMSRSMSVAVDVPLAASEATAHFDPPGPCRYEISRDQQRVLQTEEFIDRAGAVVYRDSMQVDFAVGSGQRGWTFLTDRGGILTQAPATWYTGRQVWDLSPGYTPDQHPRFSRRISDGCVACHAGRTNHLPAEPHRFGAPIFTELSIGCERCHGPGMDHVIHHRKTRPQGAQDPIVNPARLGFSQQLSVCYQCHLHGEERIARSGRSEFDFRPGDLLSDVWATFVRSASVDEEHATAAVSQVEQMHSSRCFQESMQRMTCTSCHDPHSLPSPQDRTEYYRQRCLSCHEQTDSACALERPLRLTRSAEDSCIECHMPSLPATDVPHTAQTDHRILRESLSGSASTGNSPNTFLDLSLFPLPEREQQRARGLLLAGAAESRNDVTAAASALLLLNPLVDDQSHDLAVLDAIAACSELIGDLGTAADYFQRARQLAPRNDRVLRGLLINSHKRGKLQEALKYAETILQLCPDEGPVHFQRAALLRQLGRESAALTSCQDALRLMPDDAEVRSVLIQLAEAAGMTTLADEQRALLQRINESRTTSAPANAAGEAQEQ